MQDTRVTARRVCPNVPEARAPVVTPRRDGSALASTRPGRPMRHLHTVVLSSSLILAATGCGDQSLGGGSETDATEGDPGTTGSSTTDPDDTDPGSGDVPHDLPDDPVIECAGTVVDHSADCNEGCAIVEDVRITCNATEFGDPGLRVAPSPDATLLVTAASTSAWLM